MIAVARVRGEAGRATATAARLVRSARTPAERAAAATALRVVARAHDERIPLLARLLEPAGDAAERRISAALASDTRGRDRAVVALQGLVERGVPARARAGLARAIVALSTGRQAEIEEQAEIAASEAVSPESAAGLARNIDRSLRGQARAAAGLAAVRGWSPAAARGLERALGAIAAEQTGSAQALARVSERVPEPVRPFVAELVGRTEERAAGLRGNLPVPPAAGEPPVSVPQPGAPSGAAGRRG